MRVSLFAVLLGLAAVFPAFAQQGDAPQFQEGVHYFKLDDAPARSEGPVVVTEIFSYRCVHCNSFEPYVERWMERKPEYIEFRRVPVVFGRRDWELSARGYLAAEAMGIVEESHAAMMDAIWKERKAFRSLEELGEFYSQFGVSAEGFVATAQSFAVDANLRRSQRQVQQWGISGTPSMVVDGRYRIVSSAAVPNFETMLAVANHLAAIEQAKRAPVEADGEAVTDEPEPLAEPAEG